MKVVWTANAKRELRAIHDYIAQHSQRYALGMIDRITQKTQHLAVHPEMGGRVPECKEEQVRELLEFPYRIIYAVGPRRVEILSIVHAARELPQSTVQ